MTWKPARLASMAMLGLLAVDIVGTGEAAAQFPFLFNQPRYQQRAARPHSRRQTTTRPRQAVPVKPLRPEPVFPLDAAVPLPPPRPHFPGDPVEIGPARAEDGPSREDTPKPDAATRAPGAPPQRPAEETKPPSELVKPNMPSRPEPPAATITPEPSSRTKPPVIVEPTPDELPPKGPLGAPPKPPMPPPNAPVPRTQPTVPQASPPSLPTSPPAASTAPATPPLPPEKPAELKPPEAKPTQPGVAPSGARLGETPRQPEDDSSCEARLKARDVALEPAAIGPQKDERCTVVRPVHLLSLKLPDGGRVEFPEHPTIACTTADAFSLYVRDLLAPLAKGTFGSAVSTVWTGPGLECRSRDSIVGAKLSAHGQGLAIDVAQLKLADGRKIEVGQTTDATTQAFETAARTAACGYFHTVLGPGSDEYHRTHWHFDLIVRGAQGDSKYCR